MAWHYDVTRPKRLRALRLGAQPIELSDWHEILQRRRAELDRPQKQPSPCSTGEPCHQRTCGACYPDLHQGQPSTPRELDQMAGEAFRAGNADQARGLLALACMAFPEHSEWWDKREARINGRELEAAQ